MSLVYRIILRISVFLLLIFGLWGWCFYAAMIDEINDEVDDALELYADELITRVLAGKEIPDTANGTNNSYHLRMVDEEYVSTHPRFSFSDEKVYIEEKRETEPARVLKTIFRRADGSYGELTVLTPTIEKEDLIQAIAYWTLGLFALLVMMILIVNAWIISRSMRPLYRLLQWLDKHNISKKPQPLNNPTKVTEFRKLNEALQRFSERSHELYEQQKRFIGDASHELQTPLAICRNRLEMLCDTELTEEQMGEILKTLQTLEELSELNRSLLLLSKIDNNQFPENSEVDVTGITKSALNEYKRMAATQKLEVTLHEEAHPVWTMNSALAKIMVHNLVRNAIVHNVEEGRIAIRLTPNGIVCENTGIAQPLDKAHIFDRFYKAGGKAHSTGLGLALVAAIARLYQFTVDYQYEEGEGIHRFSVSASR